MLDALKTIHQNYLTRRMQRHFDKAVALVNQHGLSVVKLVKRGDTTYIVDQKSGELHKIGKRK